MRRNQLFYFILASLILAIPSCNNGGSSNNTANPNTASSTGITVVSYGGGAYQQSHVDAFCTPFQTVSGVKVQSVSWNAEYGKLKSMVQSRDSGWDVVEVTDAEFKRGKQDDLFQKLTVLPDKTDFMAGMVNDYGVANVYWGTVLAYSPSKFPTKHPETWKDFWDVKTFPGKRAIYDDPRGNLEFALLADGVPRDKLYPLDVERAFRKLDQLKPHISNYWHDGTEAIQLLRSGTVPISTAWNGRIFATRLDKPPIGYSWDGGALELDWWVIPKSSQNAEPASRFVTFASSPERMAKQAAAIGYGPVNKSSLKFIESDIRRELPTDDTNFGKTFVVNADWWSEHEADMMRRWIAWKNK